jgi:hypothetical protein
LPSSVLLCEPLGGLDIPLLAIFVPADQQQDQRGPAIGEINSVSRPVVNPQLAEPIADRRNVAGVAVQQAIDPGQDFCFGPGIAPSPLLLIRYKPMVDNKFPARISAFVDAHLYRRLASGGIARFRCYSRRSATVSTT